MSRKSKRKLQQLPSIRSQHKSSLQLRFERAIESPGGATKILHLVRTAADREVDELNSPGSSWTPLVGAIFRLGKNTTRNGNSSESEGQLLDLIRACHRRGISANSGAWFGGHYHRPLIVAAYYGYYSAVRLFIELGGALPDLGDGEGRNSWFAAFQNPVGSGVTHRLRECDRRTARTLVDAGVVTADLGRWRRSLPKGSLCYINGDSSVGSVMLRALVNKNAEVVKFLCNVGGVITDRDYLDLRQMGMVNSRLIPMVAEVLSNGQEITEDNAKITEDNETIKEQLFCSAKSWSSRTDWSFPPTWKVGVTLCENCGLPLDIFRSYVVPFLDRDWFYTRFDIRLPLLGPSLGEMVGTCRKKHWSEMKTSTPTKSRV